MVLYKTIAAAMNIPRIGLPFLIHSSAVNLTRIGPSLLSQTSANIVSKRHMSSAKRRFYKHVTVAGTNDLYEINLDQRKLKTPLGTILKVPHYGLALAIANEWSSVKDKINPSLMHLTGLSFTAVDNPQHLTKYDLATKILEYMDTDTILYREGNEDFMQFLEKSWDPILDWFNKKFDTDLKPATGIIPAEITTEISEHIRRYLLSYDFWAVHGFLYGVEALKSPVLTLAAAERVITAEKAVFLSRVETEYQVAHWGAVEWAHDMDKYDLQARFSAAMLFISFNSWKATVKQKTKQQN